MVIGTDNKGNYYPTRIIVNNYEVQNIEPIGKIYDVRAKKNSQSPEGAGFSPKGVPLSKGYSAKKSAVITFFSVTGRTFFLYKWQT